MIVIELRREAPRSAEKRREAPRSAGHRPVIDRKPAINGSKAARHQGPVNYLSSTSFSSSSSSVKYVPCDGGCPGACTDGGFYHPRDRYADKARDKPEFRDFERKVPPIGKTYEEYDEEGGPGIKPLPCR